jgi:hypothetical protein
MASQQNSLVMLILIAFPLFLLTSCATTTNIGSWKNETYTGGPLSDVLVIGVTQQNTVRRIFEDEFAKEFSLHGVKSIPSYTLLPADLLKDMEKLEAEVRRLDPETVLITRLVGRRTERNYQSGTYYSRPRSVNYYPGPQAHDGWRGYYTYSQAVIRPEVGETVHEVAILESNIYETRTKKLIWSMQSETRMAGQPVDKLLLNFIQVAVKSLSKEGLLPK